jgi:outer membrane protein insertion porin family
LLADIGYGHSYGKTKGLPFFENYYGGGTGSVRGFKNNTLGPLVPFNSGVSNNFFSPFGGSTKIVGSAELFFPVPFLSDVKSVRLGTFFDAGSIQDNFNIHMKYSAGISGEWLSPFGALSVSAAVPLNAKPYNSSNGTGDQKQIFQFNFGQNF